MLSACNNMSAEYLFQPDKHYDVRYDTGDKTIQCGRRPDAFKLWLGWKAKAGYSNQSSSMQHQPISFEILSHKNVILYLASGCIWVFWSRRQVSQTCCLFRGRNSKKAWNVQTRVGNGSSADLNDQISSKYNHIRAGTQTYASGTSQSG